MAKKITEINDKVETHCDTSLQDIASRMMRDNGLSVVYLAADGQWFSTKENAQKHSIDAEVQVFNLKK
jgi:hypothetical protein